MDTVTVLIVEDEELIRKELEVTTPWERFGCTLIGSASNGIDGARLIEELRPDIVLTDIRMPGQDGLQMLKNAPCTSAIILTGHS